LLRHQGKRIRLKGGVVVEGDIRTARKRRLRPRRYDGEVAVALKKVWRILDYICGKRLVAALPEVVPRLVALEELEVPPTVQEKLMQISASTVDRLLKAERAKYAWRRRGGTKPGTLLKHQVPIRTFADWDEAEPGFLQMDLVAHDGGVSSGDYCQTLDLTDVCTGWAEQAAVLNRAQIWVFQALQDVRERLPFSVLGFDSDNGSEFINHELIRYCEQEGLTFTRSRPYRKNDTCYVEQKNWSVVRRFVGYARFVGDVACAKLNQLYLALRDYNNFFLPSMKLMEKSRDGARVHRRYDRPQTPYQRLLQSPILPDTDKQRLQAYYQTLNPAALHRRIRRLQKELTKLAVRTAGSVKVAASDGPAGQGQPHQPLAHRPLENAPTAGRSPQPLGKPLRGFPQPAPPQQELE